MAKILISSLGTGNNKDGVYQKAKYQFANEVLYETSFIADAILKHHKIDKLFLVGTKKSMWDEAYTALADGEDDNYYEQLVINKESNGISIDDLTQFDKEINYISSSKIIDYGKDENELWANFEKFLEIANELNDGDELYLDITHSFRSLSLMSFVMTQFASSISDKNFTIKAVYYGMFEYKNENNGITPIVDIKILLEIQEWIKAIDAIKKYSDFDPLVRLLENDSDIEKKVQNTFISLNNTIEMANMSAMKKFVENAAKKISLIQESKNNIVKLLAPQVELIVNELNKETMSDFQYNLSKWFYKNKNYALSYIALYEAVITKSCERSNYDIEDHFMREEAKKSIGNDKYGKYFYTKYDNSLSKIRNSIVHQDFIRQELVLNDIEKLEQFINHFEGYFNS